MQPNLETMSSKLLILSGQDSRLYKMQGVRKSLISWLFKATFYQVTGQGSSGTCLPHQGAAQANGHQEGWMRKGKLTAHFMAKDVQLNHTSKTQSSSIHS